MRHLTFVLLFIGIVGPTNMNAQNPIEDYLDQWIQFYPGHAYSRGIHSAIFSLEDFSEERIGSWVRFNQNTLDQLKRPSPNTRMRPIDARMVRMSCLKEIEKWTHKKPHFSSAILYTTPINRFIQRMERSEFLLPSDKWPALCQQLSSIQKLSESAFLQLENSSVSEIKRGLSHIEDIMDFLDSEHFKWIPLNSIETCREIEKDINQLQKSLRNLKEKFEYKLLPEAEEARMVLGRAAYDQELKLYTDTDITSEELAEEALREINQVRKLIKERSLEYVRQEYPEKEISADLDVVSIAFEDMENDALADGQEYLLFWQELAARARTFVDEKNIASLPEFPTLQIKTAPESAGPAARIGWVASAPPFEPNPHTTLFLPSIPEDMPEEEVSEFWSSFNKPFNRMIVIHELYPGHYMQQKIARESPFSARLFFPYGPYIEGWATFCERIALDEGWDEDRPLTFLAHLRKRLENANRAYTSVQVHCNDWNSEDVQKFSIETALLAPQFAKSLWGRLMRSPMQMTTYFWGGHQFSALFDREKERSGEQFELKAFMDTILKSGPIPIDEFEKIFDLQRAK